MGPSYPGSRFRIIQLQKQKKKTTTNLLPSGGGGARKVKMIKYQVAGERNFKVQPRGVKYSCEALEVVPGEEGFWESFWRNGLIVAAIQTWQANAVKIKKHCDNYVANPNSFENADGERIKAMKILSLPYSLQNFVFLCLNLVQLL